MKGLFDKFKRGLSKTKTGLVDKIQVIVKSKRKINDELLEEIEEILIGSDIGVDTTFGIIEGIKSRVKKEGFEDSKDLENLLKEELETILDLYDEVENGNKHTPKPHVIMVIGVNGVGKTTTIGKLAHRYKLQDKKVLLAAADTFRAAAVDQLIIWADRAGVDIVKQQMGADPASVAFDALQSATAKSYDVVIVDTAGRLHTKVNLMEELKKIKRVIQKQMATAPHEIILVLDAITGQNGIQQARRFKEAVGLSGIALTKLDGTAKGGVVIAIQQQLGIPVKYIGVGEQIDDLEYFDKTLFVKALFE